MNIDISKKGFSVIFGSREAAEAPASTAPAPAQAEPNKPEPTAEVGGSGGYGYNRTAYTVPFDGQNSLGEMGPAVRYVVDHPILSMRSWQLRLEANNYNTILKKLKDTVIGSGLKPQSNPVDRYLKKRNIEIDREQFTDDLEDLWSLLADSPMMDYAGKDTLGEIHGRAFNSAITAGDVLVILRPKNNVVKVQLVDSVHVQTPIHFPMVSEAVINYDPIERINPDTNNRVRWGIEIDDTGRHVAFHVRVGIGLSYIRVAAYGTRSGALLAYMLTDEEFRIDNARGIPRLTSGMETASQMGRYKSAMVSAAEEIAKAPYYLKHELGSTGEDPREAEKRKARDIDRPANSQLNYDAEGRAIANTIFASTNRTTINGTPGMELKALESKNTLHFEPFNTALTEEQAALAGIPPEIVASKFDSNFSASRAAFLAEGMRLSREWKKQGNHFLQPILNLQLDLWVQTFQIDAPGYLEALQNKDMYVLNAYRRCDWKGAKMGHIDPLKEAMYWRLVLGSGSAHLPMGNFEQAADGLDLGDVMANFSQYAKEMEEGDKLNIEHEDAATANNGEEGSDTADDASGKPVKKDKSKKEKAKAYWQRLMAHAQKMIAEGE